MLVEPPLAGPAFAASPSALDAGATEGAVAAGSGGCSYWSNNLQEEARAQHSARRSVQNRRPVAGMAAAEARTLRGSGLSQLDLG